MERKQTKNKITEKFGENEKKVFINANIINTKFTNTMLNEN